MPRQVIIGHLGGIVLCILPWLKTALRQYRVGLLILTAVRHAGAFRRTRREFAAGQERSWVKVSLVISVPALALLAAASSRLTPQHRH